MVTDIYAGMYNTVLDWLCRNANSHILNTFQEHNTSSKVIQNVNNMNSSGLFIFLECSLFLCVLYYLFIYSKPLSFPHCVHVPPSHVLRVCLLPKVKQLLLRRWNPERIIHNHLQKGEERG